MSDNLDSSNLKNDFGQFHITKLTSKNYSIWKIRCMTVLQTANLWELVLASTIDTSIAVSKSQSKAASLILPSVSDDIVMQLDSDEISHG